MTAKQLADLAAKVAALEIVLESLMADTLAKSDNPAAIADIMLRTAFQTEQKVRDQIGDHAVILQVTELISRLMDRAVKRAIERKKRRPRSTP